MNRGDLKDVLDWAWGDVWPNHLGQELKVFDSDYHGLDERGHEELTEALAVALEHYLAACETNDHLNAKHRAFEAIMREAGKLPAPDPGPRALAPIVGRLRIARSSFTDDTGPRAVAMCHAGDLVMRSSYDWDGAMRGLDEIRAAGYHGLRTWDRLRWGPRNPAKPISGDWGHEINVVSWQPDLRAFLRACQDRSLVVHLAAGDLAWLSGQQRAYYLAMKADLCREFGSTITLAEWANESRDTAGGLTVAQAIKDMDLIRTLVPLTGLTAYTGHEDAALFREWTPEWMRFCLVHGSRDGHWWDKIRHIFSLPYEVKTRRLWWQGEPFGAPDVPPPGVARARAAAPEQDIYEQYREWMERNRPKPPIVPGSPQRLVSATQNLHELTAPVMALGAWQAFITGQAWTYFSSPGVVLRNRRFVDQPGFLEVPKLAAIAERFFREFDLAPGELRLTHGGPGRDHAFTLTSGGETARCDQAIDDNRGVVLASLYAEHSCSVRAKWPLKQCYLVTMDGQVSELGPITSASTSVSHRGYGLVGVRA